MSNQDVIIREVMEEAGILGLCREGQVEMAVQALRRLCPDLSDEQALRLVEQEISKT